jgi:lactate racemase
VRQNIHIPYGSQRLPLFPPEHGVELPLGEPDKLINPSLFRSRLEKFLRDHPLDLRRPILVVADKTRLCGYPEYLPLLIDTLEEHGMDSAALRIVIAYGTHPPQSEAECLHAYGELYGRAAFIHHDCRETGLFVELGRTARGTPIRCRRDLLEASAVITMGAICHHYFAGYGGGRKLIFPGCGERDAIYANHSLYLDRATGTLSAGCQPGLLRENPLAEDLFAIEEKMPVDLAIHGILDSRGNLCDLLPGRGRPHFLAACATHGRACEVQSPRFATVVASCGGFPKDINFIQSHKAVHNAAMFVEDGGQLLLYCECRDGIGSETFLPWFTAGSFSAAFDRLVDRYEGNGGTALAMMTKTSRIRIGLITSLDEELCRQIGVERWHHDQVCLFLASLRPDQSLAVIANAGLLVNRAQSSSKTPEPKKDSAAA